MAVVELNLPSVPMTLKNKILEVAAAIACNDSSRQWLNEFHRNKVNAVAHSYELAPEFDREINDLYSDFFQQKIYTMIGVQRNVTDTPAETPPHCDRYRRLAINYYIELGGPKVITNFYNYIRDHDCTESVNLTNDQVDLTESYLLDKDRWYMFDSQHCHGVSNIHDLRVFVALILEENLCMSKITEKYPTLIKKEAQCIF